MKSALLACLAVAASLTATVAFSADIAPELEPTEFQTEAQSLQRTYYREHRLRAYEQTQRGYEQGATCVTDAGVCWIAKPMSQGDSCTCGGRRLSPTHGIIGG